MKVTATLLVACVGLAAAAPAPQNGAGKGPAGQQKPGVSAGASADPASKFCRGLLPEDQCTEQLASCRRNLAQEDIATFGKSSAKDAELQKCVAAKDKEDRQNLFGPGVRRGCAPQPTTANPPPRPPPFPLLFHLNEALQSWKTSQLIFFS